MVVTFDPATNKYDVVNAPGFSFKVLNVKGLPVKIENASPKTAKITIYEPNHGVTTIPYEINHNGEKWQEFSAKYDLLETRRIIECSEEEVSLNLSDYNIVYGSDFGKNGYKIRIDNVDELPNNTITDGGAYNTFYLK